MSTHVNHRNSPWGIGLVIAITLTMCAAVSTPAVAQNGSVNASQVTRIHDIQYTANPNGVSPYVGQTVTVRGVVTAIDYYGFVIAEEEGPWHAIFVYTQQYGPMIGHKVQLTGEVKEYNGLTELVSVSNYHLLGVKKFDHIKAWPADAQDLHQEAFESVLVKCQQVQVTGFTPYGQWLITDNTGSVQCGYQWDYNYFPEVGDMHESVTGIMFYAYGQYFLMPRRTNDMVGSAIPHYALHGTVVTMNDNRDVIPDAYVEILGDQIIGITKNRPNQCNQVYSVEGYILPGLIDAHNHPFWNAFDHIPFPASSLPYNNRYEWQASSTYAAFKTQHSNLMSFPSPGGYTSLNVVKLGELRALCAGTTTWQGTNCNGWYDEDYALQGIGINNAERFPARIRHIVFPLSSSTIPYIPTLLSQFWDRFVIHLCEGTDASALDEFYQLKNFGALSGRISIIHGVPLTSTEFADMAAVNAHLIWSPKSNVLLYSATANVPAALAEGVNVALAPDWTESGEFDILEELRFAESWSSANWSGSISPQQFAEFVTVNAADALGLKHRIGSIEAGKQADITVIPKLSTNPYADLLDTYARDVMLTVVGGRPMYGDPSLMQAFPFLSGEENIAICGAPKTVSWAVDSKYAWYSDEPVSLFMNNLITAYNAVTPKVAAFLHYDKCTTIPKHAAADDAPLPGELALHQNFPNPFNPVTTIEFSLPVDGDVSVVVFDALGREVETLVEEQRGAGFHTVRFDGRDLPSGLYICTLTAAGTRLSRWMTLAK